MWIARRFLRYQNSIQKDVLFTIPKTVKDVVYLRGLSDKPYIVLEGNKFELPTNTFLLNISKIYNQLWRFYDINFNQFHPSTPVIRVIFDSFFVSINDSIYFVLGNEPFIRPVKDELFAKTEGSYIIEPIVTDTIRELQGIDSVQRWALYNMMMKNVIDNSDAIKLDKLRYKELLKIVDSKIAVFEENIRIVEDKLKEKAERRVKMFSTFIFTQVAVLHYFIYFNLSWDIMEPVTVILANFDLFVAYYFFLLKGQNYSPETWKNSIVTGKRNKYLEKEGVDVRKYEQLIAIRDYLKMRLGLLSKNPLIVLETVQKPLRMMDPR